ncbi:MAG: ABC transporter substrate-binding protein [Candidatus Obscuribacterales bacterium]|nr:ABC transporter substrate-binding protein [Candidatus Obscuribacterales bacterium]
MFVQSTECRRTKGSILVSVFLTAVVSSIQPSSGAAPEGASVVGQVTQLFSTWSPKTSNRVLLDRAATLIDYEMMSEAALGDYWNKLTPDQRLEFVKTLRVLIEEKYYERWHKIFQKGQLKYRNERLSSGEMLLDSTLTVGKQQDSLIWRLKRKDGIYRVISIQVNEKDLVQQLSLRLERQTKKSDFKKLLAWMREDADVDEDHDKS